MYIIDSSNTKAHSYPTYGRQFKTYKWAKPILVSILFAVLYLILAGAMMAAELILVEGVTSPSSVADVLNNMQLGSYDTMDLTNPSQTILTLGSIVMMIPALWLVSLIVRDRPFSSYSSSRGGWSSRVFWKTMPVGIICVTIPIVLWELFHEHHLNDYQMKFTLVSFAVLTILGPLQCIAEEYVFRGLLMQTLGSWVRVPVIAVVLQAALFALAHPYNRIGQLGIFVTGLAFGLSAWIGRGIEVSSVFHICNNMTVFYLQGLNLTSISSTSDMESFMIEAAIAAAFVLVVFILSKRKNFFHKVRKDDLAAWNEKYDAKLARKEEKANARAEKIAAKNAPIGAHEESTGGKHYKQ